MGMGRRKREHQQELWIPADQFDVPRHVFYDALNRLLADGGFDDFAENLCRPYYAADVGRSSIPPGVYFRMLLIGYFEGLDSQRGIAWRCADSLSLRTFLGHGPAEPTPDHSSLTRIRDRLPLEVHTAVFQFVLGLAAEHKLLKGKTVGVDATTLEANAAMKSIVRRDSGEDWKAYLKRLMQAEGLMAEDEEPTDEDLRRFDKGRKNKKVSNAEWRSPTDGDSRIAKMKDSRTHLAYKAEHVIDLETEFILEAAIFTADQSDGDTLLVSVAGAQQHLEAAGAAAEIEEIAADKGYHKNEMLADCAECGLRTYVPVPQLRGRRRWTDKPLEEELAYRANRRRTQGARSRRLQRLRSERVERSFAHVCETGGARRTWLRGVEKVTKRYKVLAAARNLGLLMLKLFGVGKPRCLQGAGRAFAAAFTAFLVALRLLWTDLFTLRGFPLSRAPERHRMRERALPILRRIHTTDSSTAC
jgi:transposase